MHEDVEERKELILARLPFDLSVDELKQKPFVTLYQQPCCSDR